MTQTTITRVIEAPIHDVFSTVADIDNFSKAIPHIVKVEFTSDIRTGVGARFRETRVMRGRQETTELEVTEYVEDDRVRLVADSHGTVWDTVFTVRPVDGNTELTMTMDARAHALLSKLMNPLMKGMVKRAVEQDMDAVKAYCEGAGAR